MNKGTRHPPGDPHAMFSHPGGVLSLAINDVEFLRFRSFWQVGVVQFV